MNIEEAIEELEYGNKDMFMDTLYECYRQSVVKPFEKAIETLLTAYEKEKEYSIKIQKLYFEQRDIINHDYKDKIKAKIEEYKEMIKATYKDKTYHGDKRRFDCYEIIEVLQSLLEEKE